ncbi:polysaccharide pyruvyl transferase family protein [Phaeovulum sp.]|uniref:polysaccharide pyruvyl transferase family protein n=1 Tax=Phaeovulum sp. TaxID=2934796 RepID=UPI00356580D4
MESAEISNGSARSAVVLNDTSGRNHHGCSRVMRILRSGLESRGIRVSATAPAHSDWARNEAFLGALEAADLIVINGEGTLHHGRPGGARLLEVVRHAARRAPVALINAQWQQNPAAWGALLAGCALISARDHRSADEMRAAQDTVAVRMVPDLSLSETEAVSDDPRNRLLFGDSVRWGTRRALAHAARRVGADALLPTKTLPGAAWRLPVLSAGLAAAYHGTLPFGMPPMILARNEDDYLRQLATARMHITGRFHGICLSMVSRTPFLAVGSNSKKIEALLQDAGLSQDRLLTPEALATIGREDLERPITEPELASLSEYLARARIEAGQLFDDLAALAKGKKA